ncbi:BnaCnng17830D [Brassica napus]|uniref:BnaCnng17830D protein n=1 Tax=Brassica napus TaxID=3708 RepID=A0A078II27_BRANA|nr:BnaCnng17830D [Brassica napus]
MYKFTLEYMFFLSKSWFTIGTGSQEMIRWEMRFFTLIHSLKPSGSKTSSEDSEGTVIMKIQASRQNCLSEESKIVWNKGKIVQNMFLKLQNVECGEVEIQLEWIDVSGLLSIKEDEDVAY